jgi:hypothetical protein
MIAMIMLDDAALNIRFFDTTRGERCQERLGSSAKAQVFMRGLPCGFSRRPAFLADVFFLMNLHPRGKD